MKRKHPETVKLRLKLSRFLSRKKMEKHLRKKPTGIRKMTQLKYQAMKYQIEAIDETFYMKQVFLKRPSSHHRM